MGRNFSIFDVLGPVMVGPSSSHTAGAARLARVAAGIAGEDIRKVTFYLHGSFAKTYRGHGTDRALLAGMLGMGPEDERLRDSYDIAVERGLNFKFVEADLGDVHPNTVKFIMETGDGNITSVTGSSVGGGSILITEIDGQGVEFTGTYPAIITRHVDKPGIITAVTSSLSKAGINIAFMRVFREYRGQMASMVVETDSPVPEQALKSISQTDGIEKVISIKPVYE